MEDTILNTRTSTVSDLRTYLPLSSLYAEINLEASYTRAQNQINADQWGSLHESPNPDKCGS